MKKQKAVSMTDKPNYLAAAAISAAAAAIAVFIALAVMPSSRNRSDDTGTASVAAAAPAAASQEGSADICEAPTGKGRSVSIRPAGQPPRVVVMRVAPQALVSPVTPPASQPARPLVSVLVRSNTGITMHNSGMTLQNGTALHAGTNSAPVSPASSIQVDVSVQADLQPPVGLLN